MTAFASRTGAHENRAWVWDLRSVNGRGLDLRLRLPDGIEGLEASVRAALTARMARGNVTLNLRLTSDDATGALEIDAAQLDRVLAALNQVQDRAFDMGVTLAQPNAADVLSQRGVVVQGKTELSTGPLRDALLADLGGLIDDFAEMRESEGQALLQLIRDQLKQIAGLIDAANVAAENRRAETRDNLSAALRRVVEDVAEIEPSRIAQELALLAVKSDITEEIDRLRAHVKAATEILGDPKPAGRKLDFLAQEFNREANTLCSKAGSGALTSIGLDLKAVIEQMREQIQNVE